MSIGLLGVVHVANGERREGYLLERDSLGAAADDDRRQEELGVEHPDEVGCAGYRQQEGQYPEGSGSHRNRIARLCRYIYGDD